MANKPLAGQEWLNSLKPLSEEQKQKNKEEALEIQDWQQKCRMQEAKEMKELQEKNR